jgi:hypothetical protein
VISRVFRVRPLTRPIASILHQHPCHSLSGSLRRSQLYNGTVSALLLARHISLATLLPQDLLTPAFTNASPDLWNLTHLTISSQLIRTFHPLSFHRHRKDFHCISPHTTMFSSSSRRPTESFSKHRASKSKSSKKNTSFRESSRRAEKLAAHTQTSSPQSNQTSPTLGS